MEEVGREGREGGMVGHMNKDAMIAHTHTHADRNKAYVPRRCNVQTCVPHAIHRLHLPCGSSSSSSSRVLQQHLHTFRVPFVSCIHDGQPLPRPSREIGLRRILLQEALDEARRAFFFFVVVVFVVVVVVCILRRSSVVVASGGGVEVGKGRWRGRAAMTTMRRRGWRAYLLPVL